MNPDKGPPDNRLPGGGYQPRGGPPAGPPPSGGSAVKTRCHCGSMAQHGTEFCRRHAPDPYSYDNRLLALSADAAKIREAIFGARRMNSAIDLADAVDRQMTLLDSLIDIVREIAPS